MHMWAGARNTPHEKESLRAFGAQLRRYSPKYKFLAVVNYSIIELLLQHCWILVIFAIAPPGGHTCNESHAVKWSLLVLLLITK